MVAQNNFVYLANRDRPEYLSKKFNQPHNLVSVVGGLGFLSFLSHNTRTLVLIDANNEQIDYCKIIIKLIIHFDDLKTFSSAIGAFGMPDKLMEGEIREVLGKTGFITYQETILASIDSGTVDYFNFSRLKQGHFYWRINSEFPYSPFSSSERYNVLRETLNGIAISYVHSRLEDLNYSGLFVRNFLNVLCLSNCDFQFYTQPEAIYDKVIEESPRPSSVYFHSWQKSVLLHFDMHHADSLMKVAKYTREREVTEISTYAKCSFNQKGLGATAHTIIGLDGIDGFLEFGIPGDCLLFHIALHPEDAKREVQAIDFLRKARGNFRRIIILDHCNQDDTIPWLRWIVDIKLHRSYRVTGLDWAGGASGFSRNIVICLDYREQ